MNSFPLTTLWLQILALIGIEVGLIALFLVLCQRWCQTAVWRRTLCQAALITSLLIGCSELSGTGRSLISLFLRSREHPGIVAKDTSSRTRSVAETPETPPELDLAFPSKVTEHLANHRSKKTAASESSSLSHTTLQTTGPSPTFSAANSPITYHRLPITDSTTMLWLGTILAIGTAFFAGRACLGRLILVLLRSRRMAITDPKLLDRVQSLAQTFKMSRAVRIIESPRLVSPIAFGFFRPTIGLPLNFCARFSASKQEVMLTHEVAHLAARDPFWYFLADLVAAAFWWHPAIWRLRRQLHLSSELAADEASLTRVDGPRVLAECLVEMGAQLAKPVPGQLRVAGFRSDLGCRVQRLMRLQGAQWKPVSGPRPILARSIAPIVVTAVVILCTAWAVPRDLTKGDSMKTMKHNWQRALATFATMAAIQTPTILMAQGSPPSNVAPTLPAGVDPPTPQNKEMLERLTARRTEVPGALAPGAQVPAEANAPGPRNAFLARYGLGAESAPGTTIPSFVAGQPAGSAHGGQLEAKLRGIVLDEVQFDNLPLNEVLKFLGDESRKRDPERKGINFLINPNGPQIPPSPVGAVDPTTGLPLAVPPLESIDVASVNVRFNMPLRHVTLADVLDAIVRVADKPIQYSVEDYAVVFSLRRDANPTLSTPGRNPGPAPSVVGTFHVDTNALVGGLESAFGIKVEIKGKGESQSRKIQSALKELLALLNVSMEGNKAIFYNELNGTLMVRVAVEDLNVIQAAVETLGGQAIGSSWSIPASPSAASR